MRSHSKIQYTLRGVPEETDRLVRERATEYGTSLNEAALQALKNGLGQEGGALHHDFDKYARTWVQDHDVDDALEAQRKIDPDLWS